jgi:hypothetical protein
MQHLIAALAVLVSPMSFGADDPAPDTAPPNTALLMAPLLPEGGFVREARGHVDRIGPGHPWIFSIAQEDDPTSLAQKFTLLPSHLLEEIELEIADQPQRQIDFTLSGQILLYGNDNYLILEHVEMETEHAQRPGTQVPLPIQHDEHTEPNTEPHTDPPTPATPTDDPWAHEDDDFDTMDQGDSVAAIVAQLQKDVGPLKQSVDRSTEITVSPAGAAEGDLLISRRARLTRGRYGAWIMVFDADAQGLMEPPVILLPSQQLRSLETWARSKNMGESILLSGQIYSYRGIHFLLPTAWRTPVERPNIK